MACRPRRRWQARKPQPAPPLKHERPYANELIGAHSTGPVTGGADWVCLLPDHWVYKGTGMKKGDRIPGLVGWEFHGEPAKIPGLEVVAVVPHLSGDLMRGRREQVSYADFYGAPVPGPVGHEVVANAAMKLGGELFVERCGGKVGRVEGLLDAQHALAEQRGYFRVGEEAARGFEIAGGSVRACISWRVLNATGSRSKAML